MRHALPAFGLAQMCGIVAVELATGLHVDASAVVDWLAGLAPWALLAALVFVVALAGRAPSPAFVVGCLAFALLGATTAGRLRVGPEAQPDEPIGTRHTVEARVERVQPAVGRVRVGLCRLVALAADGGATPWPGCIRLVVSEDEPGHGFWRARRRGDRVRGHVVWAPIDAFRNPGLREREGSARRRGVWARARLAHPEAWVSIEPRAGAPWEAPATRLVAGLADRRSEAIERLQALGEGGRLLAALGLGASGGLDRGLRDAMARLGLSHLVAVSGLHLAMTAALAFACVGVLARSDRITARVDPEPLQWTAAALAAGGYALASGLGTPVRRALVFLVLLLVVHAWGRRVAWGRAWWAAAICVLAADPAALFELGPQLSFGVTAALAAARYDEPELLAPGRLERWVRAARAGVAASAVALASSALLLAAHGRASTAWSLVANVLAIPSTGVLLLPSALLASAVAWAAPTGPVADGALGMLAWGPGVFDRVVRAAAEAVGPLASTGTIGPAGWSCALLAAALTLRARSLGLRAATACLCVTALGALPADPRGSHRRPEIVVLDVGQGDATLVRGGGASMLIDAGWAAPTPGGFDAGRHVVVPALRSLGVSRLDLLVLTHADLDHRGGAAAVLEALEVEEIWVPGSMVDAPVFAALRTRAERADTRWRGRTLEDDAVRIGPFAVEVLWPPPSPPGADVPAHGNESSLVLRIEAGGSRALLMGDAGVPTERRLLASARDLRAEVLKVGHHGSATASSAAFLHAVSPRWALISAGCGVGRSLPHSATLARLVDGAQRVLWTGRDGALRIELGPGAALRRVDPMGSPRRCRFDAIASGAEAATRTAPPAAPTRDVTLPLWGGSRRVVAPRERSRHGWGRRTTSGPEPERAGSTNQGGPVPGHDARHDVGNEGSRDS